MKKILLLAAIMATAGVAYDWQTSSVHSYTTGAPAGYTGSPSDGFTCARSGCHVGPHTNQPGWITSDIPANGYIPGQTYNLTASVTQNGVTKFGFQLSPQDASGNLIGTMTATANTKLVGSNKYMTHLSSSTSGTGSKAWTFPWTAPTTGTGEVTFYAAFNASNSNSSTSGDDIYVSSLTVQEGSSVSVNDVRNALQGIRMYPNPSTDRVLIEHAPNATLEVFNLSGQMVSVNWQQISQESTEANVSDWDRGTYLVRITDKGNSNTLRLAVL